MATVISSTNVKLCDMCQRGSKSSPATTWCYDCAETLCEQCNGFHQLAKLYSKHRSVSIQAVTEEEIAASNLDTDVNCEFHPDEHLKLYCETHRQFCCFMCAVTSHKECSAVVPLGDLIQRSKDKEKFHITEFSKIASYAQKLVVDEMTAFTDLEKGRTSIMSEAFRMINITKQKLDTLYDELQKTVQKKYDKAKQAHEKTLGVLQKFCSNIEEYANNVTLLRHVPQHKSIVMMEKMRQEAEKQYTEITEHLKKYPNVKFKFKPDSTMTLIMNTLSNLGDVEEEVKLIMLERDAETVEDIIKSLDVRLLMATPAQHPVLAKQDLLTAKVNLVRVVTRDDLNIKGKLDFCNGTFVDDKTCLFTDYANSRLVMLNEDLKVKRELKVEEEPAGIALSQDKTGVYVACQKAGILLYSLQGDNKMIRKIDVKPDVYGVGVSGDIIITGHEDSVIQRDIQWKGKETVSVKGCIGSIAVSNDGTRFCHKDGGQICCRDVKTFKEIFRYGNKDLSDPWNICVDYNDNVYTVGLQSENVHQISRDGSRHRVLFDKLNRIVKPWAIVFHPSRPMFIVTSDNEDTVMEVYEFS